MPGIVDADEDAQHIGIEVEAIFFPSGVKIHHAVAGNTPVDDIVSIAQVITEDPGCHESGISGAVTGIGFGKRFAVASGVGNRVTLKKYTFHKTDPL